MAPLGPEGREALALLWENGFIPGGMPWTLQAAEWAVEQVCRTGLALELTFPCRAQSFVPRCLFSLFAKGNRSARASGVSVLQKTWLQGAVDLQMGILLLRTRTLLDTLTLVVHEH